MNISITMIANQIDVTMVTSAIFDVLAMIGAALTRWLLAYDIFVLRFWPKKQQFSVALPTP